MNHIQSKHIIAATVATFALISQSGHSQGSFENLDFESANVSGYAQNSDNVPISQAMPGWSAPNSGGATALVWYDALSTGGYMIAINDTSFQGVPVLQGTYSAWLFGGADAPATISQTGVVPSGTQSLLMDIASHGFPFMVTLGGQTLSMDPLQTFSTYTLYGANISAFAGQTEQLSITSPAPTGTPPNVLEIDNIQFSNQEIPEPQTWNLLLCGAGALSLWRWKRKALTS
jgi:hypothetical protein